MFNQLSTFVQIKVQKDGSFKLINNPELKANIGKLLREFGYHQSKMDNEIVYYKRTNKGLKKVRSIELTDAIEDYLENTDFIELSNNITLERIDIIDWFYGILPMKLNGSLSYYLKGTLSENEKNQLKKASFD